MKVTRVAVITIAADTVTIEYTDTDFKSGLDTVMEVYKLDKKGVLQPHSGNFEDEAIFDDNDELVCALTSLAEPAGDVLKAIINYKKKEEGQ